MTHGLSDQDLYASLLLTFPPSPIRTEEQFKATQRTIDKLIDQETLAEDERDYLNLLGTLVCEYEEQAVDISDIDGVERLEVLIQDFDLRQKDLTEIFKTESIVSDVLNRKRSLTVEHIQKLAHFFHISPAAFFKSVDDQSDVA